MSEIPFFFRFATVLFLFSTSSSAHSRHLLHQPFFPITTTSPPPSSQPPAPSPHSHYHHNHKTPPPHEKHPFSSSTNPPPPPPPHPNTFFPSSTPSNPPPSPPPPPPRRPAVPTFPANISSLVFPTHNKPHNNTRHVTKILALTISVVSASLLLSLLAALIIFLRRKRHHHPPDSDAKSNLHLFNAAPSDSSPLKHHKQPPKYTSSNTSSEFLYLGTLVNSGLADQQKSPISSLSSTGVLELPQQPHPTTSSSTTSSSASYSHYQKLGSPELRPLPPLPKLPVYTPNYRSTELLNPKRQDFDDNEDEFYSPSGSPTRKQQSPPRVWALKSCSTSSSSSFKPPSPRLSVNSSNGSVSKKPVPTRPPPPPPLPPHPKQIREVPAAATCDSDKKEEILRTKLKPLHWDKVRASSSRGTVWDQIKSNSFQ